MYGTNLVLKNEELNNYLDKVNNAYHLMLDDFHYENNSWTYFFFLLHPAWFENKKKRVRRKILLFLLFLTSFIYKIANFRKNFFSFRNLFFQKTFLKPGFSKNHALISLDSRAARASLNALAARSFSSSVPPSRIGRSWRKTSPFTDISRRRYSVP